MCRGLLVLNQGSQERSSPKCRFGLHGIEPHLLGKPKNWIWSPSPPRYRTRPERLSKNNKSYVLIDLRSGSGLLTERSVNLVYSLLHSAFRRTNPLTDFHSVRTFRQW